MLGNFSFGDYFKEKSISWAWEFVTDVLGLDEKRLWITIYKDDDEAFTIWHEKIGVPNEKIIRMGKKENFWQIGTGPCGPCSEIHYDRGEEYGTGQGDIAEEDQRFLEIWNLVFSQYNYTKDGEYLTLPDKNIDTGMGLERVASILQGVDSNFETDLLKPMIDFVVDDTGIKYRKNEKTTMAYRVIADHIRSVTMAIADGALPSNEGRGYVIRRLIRRAVRYGSKLGYEEPFLYRLVPVVSDTMGSFYGELNDQKEHLKKVIKAEEERFLQTLDQGLDILNDMIKKMRNNKKTLSGENAFKLYDTYGFPLDLTEDVLQEKGFKVDQSGFDLEMKKQKERARQAREKTGFNDSGDIVYKKVRDKINNTEFTGYRNLQNDSEILAIIKDGQEVNKLSEGESGEIILDRSPFYTESGGQIGDKGLLEDKLNRAEVYDTQKEADLSVHFVKIKNGELNLGQMVKAIVYRNIRNAIARNHSSTHLLHKALREVLGEHVKQSGSLVTPDRLRFDFSHFSSVKDEEISEIEEKVNQQILDNLAVEVMETTMDKARDLGAIALFNEKYGKQVRVVQMGDYSIELCGGTHVDFTGEIGLFKIINESSIAAGIRRIEAVTGFNYLDYFNSQEIMLSNIAETLKTNPDKIEERIEQLVTKQKKMEIEITSLKDKLANYKSKNIKDQIEEINGISVLVSEIEGVDNEGLRNMIDELKDKMESGIIVLGSRLDDKVIFVSSVSQDLIEEGYHAGKIIGRVAQVTGGGGGGRPDMAQAGGSKPGKLPKALSMAKNIIAEK
jgi:alanyl-tRNA synthetase